MKTEIEIDDSKLITTLRKSNNDNEFHDYLFYSDGTYICGHWDRTFVRHWRITHGVLMFSSYGPDSNRDDWRPFTTKSMEWAAEVEAAMLIKTMIDG